MNIISNLINLEELSISKKWYIKTDPFENTMLCKLINLKKLTLQNFFKNEMIDILKNIVQLPNLSELIFIDCSLPETLDEYLPQLNLKKLTNYTIHLYYWCGEFNRIFLNGLVSLPRTLTNFEWRFPRIVLEDIPDEYWHNSDELPFFEIGLPISHIELIRGKFFGLLFFKTLHVNSITCFR